MAVEGAVNNLEHVENTACQIIQLKSGIKSVHNQSIKINKDK